jgi:Flp pilus assembly pilin Flp
VRSASPFILNGLPDKRWPGAMNSLQPCNFELTTRFHLGMIVARNNNNGGAMVQLMKRLWFEEQGQDIAEYAVMLAVILVLVVGTIRLIGTNSNNVFSSVASSIGQ